MSWFNDAFDVMTLGAFESPDQPAAPDYRGAAEATAQGNLELARQTTLANRPSQYTPWGSSVWTQDQNNPDLWNQTVTLTPEQQNLFNTQQRTNQAMADMGLAGFGAASDIFKTPIDMTSLGELPNYGSYRQNIMDNMLARVNEQTGQDRDAMVSQLIASGIPRGSEAFNREMAAIDRKLTDARQQAELAATQQTGQMLNQDIESRRQKIAEMLTRRQTPLNELNALRTGNQVSMPQFSPVPQQNQVLGPDYMGATTATGNWNLAGWNADVARNNAMIGGLFDLGAAAIGRQ